MSIEKSAALPRLIGPGPTGGITFEVKLATKVLFAVNVKVYSTLVETIFTPSDQFLNVYPTEGIALTVTDAPELNLPAPFVVPPSCGLDDSATVNCAVTAVKLATNVLFAAILKV